ncbi:MAG: restriction endonuclease [Chloroflexi bacterium CG08_land_8_20_14_0_20_45_12]|nr:MAG: restriction endonuclease [Chloroflexi bacterium CG08_land_8_20_14_0_20_45_12]
MEVKVKFTYEDYRHMPDDKRYELLEGDLVMAPSPVEYHQRISGNLQFLLQKFVRERNLGFVYDAPFDVVLSEENVVQPDILFVSREHSPIITAENIKGAPDLVIEITSPATEYRDREIKRKLYANYGVKEYWLVDLDKETIEVMELSEGGFKTAAVYTKGEKVQSPTLVGLSFDPREVF